MSINISIVNEDWKVLFSHTLDHTPQIKTEWLKGAKSKPHTAIISVDGINHQITLDYRVNRHGKETLLGYQTIGEHHYKVLFSYGTDPSNPSFRGTISRMKARDKYINHSQQGETSKYYLSTEATA